MARGFTRSDADKQCEIFGTRFRGMIAGKEAAKSLPRMSTIKAAGISQAKFYDNLKHGGKWRIEEVVAICSYLGIDAAQLFAEGWHL